MLYAGVVAAAFYNANPFRGKDSPTISPADFVPDYKRLREAEQPQSLEEQIAILTKVMGCGPDQAN